MSKIVSGNLPLVITYEVSPWDAWGMAPVAPSSSDSWNARVPWVSWLVSLLTRPAVSQHLRVLKAAGLVFDRAEGTRRVYGSTRTASNDCAAISTASGHRR